MKSVSRLSNFLPSFPVGHLLFSSIFAFLLITGLVAFSSQVAHAQTPKWQCDYNQYLQRDCQGEIRYHGTNPTENEVNPESRGCRNVKDDYGSDWKSYKWTDCTCIYNCDLVNNPEPPSGTGTCGSTCESSSDCESGYSCNTQVSGKICWNESICGGGDDGGGDDEGGGDGGGGGDTPPVSYPLSLVNPSFESGNFEGWVVMPSMDSVGTFVVDSQQYPGGYDGRYYAKLTRKLDGGDPHVPSEWVNLSEDLRGKTIRVSFAVRTHDDTTTLNNLNLQTASTIEPLAIVHTKTLPAIAITSEWTTKSYLVTIDEGGDLVNLVRFVLRPDTQYAGDFPVYYDNIKVELVASAYEAGDFDRDGDIDLNDLRLLVQNIFGQNFTYDLNQDQQVNIFDYNVMLAKLQ